MVKYFSLYCIPSSKGVNKRDKKISGLNPQFRVLSNLEKHTRVAEQIVVVVCLLGVLLATSGE